MRLPNRKELNFLAERKNLAGTPDAESYDHFNATYCTAADMLAISTGCDITALMCTAADLLYEANQQGVEVEKAKYSRAQIADAMQRYT